MLHFINFGFKIWNFGRNFSKIVRRNFLRLEQTLLENKSCHRVGPILLRPTFFESLPAHAAMFKMSWTFFLFQVNASLVSCVSLSICFTLEDSLYSPWFSLDRESGAVCVGDALDFESVSGGGGGVVVTVVAHSCEPQDIYLLHNSSASLSLQIEDANEHE